MLSLSRPNFEVCVCGAKNPPSAYWCSSCGIALGDDPKWPKALDWNSDFSSFNVKTGDLGGQVPRFWLTGGAGAWIVAEDPRGIAFAHPVGLDGFADGVDPIELGRFDALQAIEATRRGLAFVSDGSLVTAILSQGESPIWTSRIVTSLPNAARIVGLSKAPLGQFYVLVADEGNTLELLCGTGVDKWRSLATGKHGSDVESWYDIAASEAGDFLCWGGGIKGFFDASSQSFLLRENSKIAEKSSIYVDRIKLSQNGEWSNWTRDCPVMIALNDGNCALLAWRNEGLLLAETGHETQQFRALSCASDIVFARSENQIFRFSIDPSGKARKVLAKVSEIQRAKALPTASGVDFIVQTDAGLTVEQVDSRDKIPSPRTAKPLPNSNDLKLVQLGFDALPVAWFGSQMDVQYCAWFAALIPARYGDAEYHRIFKLEAA